MSTKPLEKVDLLEQRDQQPTEGTAISGESKKTVTPRRLAAVPQQAPALVTPMAMLARAVENGATMEVIEKMMDLSERWEAKEARKAFDNAIAAAKAEIPVIHKNRTVSYPGKNNGTGTSYRHEDLAEIARTITPILATHGLSYRYRTTSEINQPVTVTCIVSHRDGHFEETTLCAGRDDSGSKNSIQAVGSTLTYLQRMTIKAALGLAASDDDDGASSEEPGALSPAQLEQVIALAEEVGADKARFCKLMGVDSLAQIPAGRFDETIAKLETKRAKS